jgi:hypothetical protein
LYNWAVAEIRRIGKQRQRANDRRPRGWNLAESRVGRFIGGRLEDRIDQVREVRGVDPAPAPPGRQLRIRDEHGEHLIPM